MVKTFPINVSIEPKKPVKLHTGLRAWDYSKHYSWIECTSSTNYSTNYDGNVVIIKNVEDLKAKSNNNF